MTESNIKRVLCTQELVGLDANNELKDLLKDFSLDILTSPPTYEDLLGMAKDYDALITMLSDQIDETFLLENSHLKVIANYAVGFNNIAVKKAKELSIKVGNTPGVLTHSTAETALTLLLMLSRNVVPAMDQVKKGNWKKWEPIQYNGIDLREKKLGIIGLGRIGQDFARKCFQLWNCEILVHDRKSVRNLDVDFPLRIVSEEQFYGEVEILSLHCPKTEETTQMINHHFLKQFKNLLFFINTARGECHVEEDLLEALNTGILKGVGLDVTSPEPMLPTSPLLSHSRCLVLPHIGSATDKTRLEMTRMALLNIRAGLEGSDLPYPCF